jgi:hypothetical protein
VVAAVALEALAVVKITDKVDKVEHGLAEELMLAVAVVHVNQVQVLDKVVLEAVAEALPVLEVLLETVLTEQVEELEDQLTLLQVHLVVAEELQ